jgi:hypothetical protein
METLIVVAVITAFAALIVTRIRAKKKPGGTGGAGSDGGKNEIGQIQDR